MYAKTAIRLFVLCICLLGLVKGSCISYGHSCWGAHGKRSTIPLQRRSQKDLADRWAYLKLIPDKVERYGINSDTASLVDIAPALLDGSYYPNSEEALNEIRRLNLQKPNNGPTPLNKYDRLFETSNNEDDAESINPQIDETYPNRNLRLMKIFNKADKNLLG